MKEAKETTKTNIELMVDTCEQLCDTLRMMRRTDPNKFFDSPEEKLLKNMDAALTGYYRGGVDEPREVTKLKRDMHQLYERINELERELAQYESKENK